MLDASMKPKPPQRLFIPGPTDVLPNVLDAQTEPMIGHRSDEFESLFSKIQVQLRAMFETDQRVYIVASSGSGMQEAAIRNCVPNRVLCCVNGAFGRRWQQVAEGCGKETVAFDVEWNSAIKPAEAGRALEQAMAEGPVDAITVVYNETSTGVLNPVPEIAAVVRESSPQTLILVDAVSAFGGTRVSFDEWGLDLCLTSSQKALALPPGLALCAVNDRVLTRAESVSGRGWYFDFLNLEKSLKRNTTPATPAISLMRALSLQLDHIFAEGLDARYQRHRELGELTREWAVANGFELAAEKGYESPTVTSIVNTLGISVTQLNEYLTRQGMLISDGYGPFKGKSFRIAHMGEVTFDDMQRLIGAMDAFLARQGSGATN